MVHVFNLIPYEIQILMCGYIFLSGTQGPQVKDLVLIKVTEWYELGLQLGVDDAELEEIEKNNRRHLRACRRSMFRPWLRITPSPSYQQLVEALTTVGEGKEADLLCKKYSRPLNLQLKSAVRCGCGQ